MPANRREVLVGLASGVLLSGVPALARAAAPGSWVLYVSAGDCPNCRSFEAFYESDFVGGLRKNGIDFRNVKVTSFSNVRNPSDWPADYKWVLDAFPRMKGTPWFLLMQGRTITARAFGLNGYKAKFAPLAA